MPRMARVTDFLRALPAILIGDDGQIRLAAKFGSTLQRRIVRQIHRLAKDHYADSGRVNLTDGRRLSWLYLPPEIKLHRPNGTWGLNLQSGRAMIVVTERRWFPMTGYMISIVDSYLMPARGGDAVWTIHLLDQVYNFDLDQFVPTLERHLNPFTEFTERNDIMRPEAADLLDLLLTIVAIDE